MTGTRIQLDLDYEEIAKLEPSVANAIFQLADLQSAEAKNRVNPDRGHQLKVESVDTEEAELERLASQEGPDGGRLGVDLTEGSPPWRPRHQQ